MTAAAPSFLAFEDWKSMSEREQDALLDRLEAQSGPGLLGRRVLIGLMPRQNGPRGAGGPRLMSMG
jgi:hypothetical protein